MPRAAIIQWADGPGAESLDTTISETSLNGLKPVSLINCWKPASPGWIFVNMNWPNGEAFAAVTLAPAITWAFETVKVSRSILLLWALAVVGATARTTAV